MAITEIKTYRTSDGTLFESQWLALDHEARCMFNEEVKKYVGRLLASGQHGHDDRGNKCWYEGDLVGALQATGDKLGDLADYLKVEL